MQYFLSAYLMILIRPISTLQAKATSSFTSSNPKTSPINVSADSDSGNIGIYADEAFEGPFNATTLHGDIGVETSDHKLVEIRLDESNGSHKRLAGNISGKSPGVFREMW